MTDISAAVKSIFNEDVVKMLLATAITFAAVRLGHKHVLCRITGLKDYPEVSALIGLLVGAFLPRNLGMIKMGVITGSGLSLLDDLSKRFGVELL